VKLVGKTKEEFVWISLTNLIELLNLKQLATNLIMQHPKNGNKLKRFQVKFGYIQKMPMKLQATYN